MRILTVWHRLLILFLKRKNEILQTLTGITYVSDVDMEEVKTWSKADVKKVLDNMTTNGDRYSCPWCIINDYKTDYECVCCSYGTRNQICAVYTSTYKRILKYMESNGLNSSSAGICSNQDIKYLIEEFIKINKLLPEIL